MPSLRSALSDLAYEFANAALAAIRESDRRSPTEVPLHVSRPLSSSVGHAIQARRERAGLALVRVARESGVSVTDLRAIESGRTQASIGVLDRVAHTLGSTLADVVRGAWQADGAPGRPSSPLGVPEIARAIIELPDDVGSKVDAVTSVAVLRAMEESGDNKSAAARLLGMDRKVLVRRLGRARRKR